MKSSIDRFVSTHMLLPIASCLAVVASHGLAVARAPLASVHSTDAVAPAAAGERGGPPLVLLAGKVLLAEYGGRATIDGAALVIADGQIAAIELARDFVVPDGSKVIDLGDRWVMPGMIDLHSHVAAPLSDLSDSVYLANPGMRIGPAIQVANTKLENGVAGGVTAVLAIPGSATNMGGGGVLMRLGLDDYEESLLRDPGSLKLAQSGNPERWSPHFPRRSFMNWNTRSVFRRGIAYAKKWEAFEKSLGERPERDLQLDIFRALYKKETQVSTHTQMFQVVEMTITMVRENFGLDVYIDHGTFDGYRAAEHAQRAGVPAIIGPRMISPSFPGFIDQDGRVEGVAAMYQKAGHKTVGFNTDTIGRGGMQQEELALQAAMACRYGFDDVEMDGVRGLTIVPAIASGLDGKLGSIEIGKDADLVVTTGNPMDPRVSIELVLVDGRLVYDPTKEFRRF
ncbi:MAG: imidazolonepropionase-like amidohydrolase [Planctomycetota bacterium]